MSAYGRRNQTSNLLCGIRWFQSTFPDLTDLFATGAGELLTVGIALRLFLKYMLAFSMLLGTLIYDLYEANAVG
jgi:ammonia channel protein AmtB